jgi:hypothetical protein
LTFKEVDAGAQPLAYTEDAPKGICSSSSEKGSMFFVPRLSRVARKSDGSKIMAGDLDSTYLLPQPGGPVAAYMPISYGTLTSFIVMPVVWEFKASAGGSGGTKIHEIADEVAWTFTVPGNTLTLQSNGKDLLSLTADPDGQIDFYIANAPDPDGIDVLSHPEPSTLGKRPPTIIFRCTTRS